MSKKVVIFILLDFDFVCRATSKSHIYSKLDKPSQEGEKI